MSFFNNLSPVIFHPGDFAPIPGNTEDSVLAAQLMWKSFNLPPEQYHPAIEADFRVLGDNTPIASRHPNAPRGDGRPWSLLNKEDLEGLNAAEYIAGKRSAAISSFRIPTLQAYCRAIRNVDFRLIAEIKVNSKLFPGQKHEITDIIMAGLKESGFTPHDAMITCFDQDVLEHIANKHSAWKRGLMIVEADMSLVETAIDRAGIHSVHIEHQILISNKRMIRQFAEKKVHIFPFVVNDGETAKQLLAYKGIKGVLSDIPGTVMPIAIPQAFPEKRNVTLIPNPRKMPNF